jgi:hypothetical protein
MLHIVEAAAGCSVQPVARRSWQLPVYVVAAQLEPKARQATLHV